MRIEINHNCADFDSYRAARVKSMFNVESGCNWQHVTDLPIDGDDWQIGLIVGPSGSGKTSIGNRVWAGGRIYDLNANWDNTAPIIDNIAPDGNFDEVTAALSAVGLGDVPAWLRPFNVLSNGEKFRAGLARLIAERPTRVVVDEFTSVIDRQIAQVGAAAFAKSWRRGKGQIILLSCHYDIINWLNPDWVYNTEGARFSRDCLRRPEINLDIYRVNGKWWRYFEPHHYLKLPFPVCAEYFLGIINGLPVCHAATSPYFQNKAYRLTRLVVLPEWQGIGIGTRFLTEIARLHKEGFGRKGMRYTTYFKSSHPNLCNSLRRHQHWEQVNTTLYGKNKVENQRNISATQGRDLGGFGGHFRATQSFKFIGDQSGLPT